MLSGCGCIKPLVVILSNSPYSLGNDGVVQLNVWDTYPPEEGPHRYMGTMTLTVTGRNWSIPVVAGYAEVPIPSSWQEMEINVVEWYNRYGYRMRPFSFRVRTPRGNVIHDISVDSSRPR